MGASHLIFNGKTLPKSQDLLPRNILELTWAVSVVGSEEIFLHTHGSELSKGLTCTLTDHVSHHSGDSSK